MLFILDMKTDGWNNFQSTFLMFNIDFLKIFDTTVNLVINVPQCKIVSPNGFLHASFVEERMKQLCPEIRKVEIDALTGNVTLNLFAEDVPKVKGQLYYLQDRLGNPINVYF